MLPNILDTHTFELGKEYADREWLGSILQTEPYVNDLDGLLVYQPMSQPQISSPYAPRIKNLTQLCTPFHHLFTTITKLTKPQSETLLATINQTPLEVIVISLRVMINSGQVVIT